MNTIPHLIHIQPIKKTKINQIIRFHAILSHLEIRMPCIYLIKNAVQRFNIGTD